MAEAQPIGSEHARPHPDPGVVTDGTGAVPRGPRANSGGDMREALDDFYEMKALSEAQDEAGNFGTANRAVVFDFAPPGLSGTRPSPCSVI